MNPKFEIYEGYGQDGSIIFKASTTCYRSEDKTQRNANDFIKMLKVNKHMSMLEFSWFVFAINVNTKDEHGIRLSQRCDILHDIYSELITQKYLHIDPLWSAEKIIVSGNGRALIEVLENFEFFPVLYYEMYKYLNHLNPVLFDQFITLENFSCDYNAKQIYVTEVDELSTYISEYNKRHNWVAVKFFDVSRGFTHELVRHRTMSFAQASTRYIDNSNFSFVFPEEELKKYPTLEGDIEKIKRMYSFYLKCGMKKDLARQLLPIGIANEICVAGRIKDWEHIFSLRCSPSAHWEIREMMTALNAEFHIRGLI